MMQSVENKIMRYLNCIDFFASLPITRTCIIFLIFKHIHIMIFIRTFVSNYLAFGGKLYNRVILLQETTSRWEFPHGSK